jgi:hypothetical protein
MFGLLLKLKTDKVSTEFLLEWKSKHILIYRHLKISAFYLSNNEVVVLYLQLWWNFLVSLEITIIIIF